MPTSKAVDHAPDTFVTFDISIAHTSDMIKMISIPIPKGRIIGKVSQCVFSGSQCYWLRNYQYSQTINISILNLGHLVMAGIFNTYRENLLH